MFIYTYYDQVHNQTCNQSHMFLFIYNLDRSRPVKIEYGNKMLYYYIIYIYEQYTHMSITIYTYVHINMP
jgi:hypothetical protein